MAEQVSGAATQQHEAGEGKQVAVHHPGQGGGRKAEFPADRGQGDVNDGRVQDHYELAGTRQRQDHPGGAACGLARRVAVLVLVMTSSLLTRR
jgi:hypothetical protein